MGDVISIDARLGLSDEKKDDILKRRKATAVQRVLQCARCGLKCEKCGAQISDVYLKRLENERTPKLPYRFCELCVDEYREYIHQLQGKGDPDCYWHNTAWIKS